MTALLIVLAVLAFVAFGLLVMWALCRAASLADRVPSEQEESRDRWAA